MLLEVKNLKAYFYLRSGIYKAVEDVSFSIDKGQSLAIVGESGSGKSVSMLSIMGLIPTPPGKIEGGTAMFGGKDLLTMSQKELRTIRGKRIAMIFQDPMTSLNPYLKISTQLEEVLYVHERVSRKTARHRTIEALEFVGIPNPQQRIDQYPHQFSGGMRQRVMIAMALLSKPDLLIADEPTTALDVTIQAQILELLKSVQKETGMGLVIISHDLGVVAGMSENVLVMYAGRVVERGTTREIFYKHAHPYTAGLLKSIPKLDGSTDNAPLYAIPGLPPDPAKLPAGCAYAPRCSLAEENCRQMITLPYHTLTATHEHNCRLHPQIASESGRVERLPA